MIIKFNLTDIQQILGCSKSLYELEENDALVLVQGIIAKEISNITSQVKLWSFEQGCPDSWHGLISNIEWSISWDEDYEEGAIELTQIDEERQKQEIKEILAGLSTPMPGLAAFFYVMQKKIVDEGISYGDAWNWVTGADGDHSLAQPLGDAIANFREYELIPRLEYEPDVDALDEALEEWITYHDWSEGEDNLNYWTRHKKWPDDAGRLTGQELIDKVEACSGFGKSKLVIACGYGVSAGPDGKTKADFTAFYEALLKARQINLDALLTEQESEWGSKSPSPIINEQQAEEKPSDDYKELEGLKTSHEDQLLLELLSEMEREDSNSLGFKDSKEKEIAEPFHILDWDSIDSLEKLKAWIQSFDDDEVALEALEEYYDVLSQDHSAKWIAAAILGIYTEKAYGFKEDYNSFWAQLETQKNASDHSAAFYIKLAELISEAFYYATGLHIVDDNLCNRLRVDQSPNANEPILPCRILASNSTLWLIRFEAIEKPHPPILLLEYQGSLDDSVQDIC